MRSRDWLLAVITALGLIALYPMQDTVSAQSGTGMVISEFRFRGPSGANDEFIELFNAGTAPVNIGGWQIRSSNNVLPPSFFTRAVIPANTVINPGCYFLVANSLSTGYSGTVPPNLTYNVGIADDGGVALTTSSTSTIVDQVGQGTVAAAYGEGQRLPMLNTNVNRGLERRQVGAAVHVDTNNNFNDFAEVIPARPKNNTPASCVTETIYLPHEIQGPGTVSPIAAGTSVTVRGVVTARTSNGFFIQTEEGEVDFEAETSEGLFVSASGPALATAVVGRMVRATGLVTEFVPASDPGSASVTQLTSVTAVTDVGAAAVPTAIEMSPLQLSELGSLDQLERFEGMRISAASLTAVSGSEAGAFYAVLTGQPRTFREPGVPAGDPVPPCAIGPCNIPLFDGNPERLRVDSDGLEGVTAVAVSSGAILENVTGPLDFSNRSYTLLSESLLAPVGGTPTSTANAPLGNEFTVASFTLGGTFASQLPKASLLIRNTLAMPDIIAVQEVADLDALTALASAIDADAAIAGQAPPQYAPFLVEGTHPDGLESGFLIKQARVTMLSVDQAGADATFTDPADSSTQLLHQRPPLVLRAVVSGVAQLPQTVTVIANHLDPFGSSATALAKREAQAEFLASYIQGRQSNDPAETIISVGNYNAHRFDDGYVDSVGIALGTPVSPDQVAIEALDLVSPDLISAGDSLDPSHRYSSIANGNAQLFDHVLMSANLASQFTGVAYPRVNADFADTLRDDVNVPNRVSDRDPVVAYFSFPPDVDAPIFSFTPGDEVAEATSAAGAVVNFAVPTASDNLDVIVAVNCAPAAGSMFALGSTGVTCSAEDVAGNHVDTSFSVTVQDTSAPILTVPGPIVVEATSSAGAVVTFTVSATDLVTASPMVGCSRPSGSVFRIGTTSNTCYTFDAAGNGVSTTFLVTVTQPVAGRMVGTGEILNGAVRTAFAFEVRQTSNFSDRGLVTMLIRGGTGRPDRLVTATVTDVSLSNSLGYTPGRLPLSGVDSAVFSGVAAVNGQPGYRVEITASDRGEPGVGSDRFTMRLLAADGTVVDSGSGALRAGNIQSLR